MFVACFTCDKERPPEDVMAMQEYLEKNEDELRRLQSAIDDDLMGRLALLSTVRHGLEEDAFSHVYATAGWPTAAERGSACVLGVDSFTW